MLKLKRCFLIASFFCSFTLTGMDITVESDNYQSDTPSPRSAHEENFSPVKKKRGFNELFGDEEQKDRADTDFNNQPTSNKRLFSTVDELSEAPQKSAGKKQPASKFTPEQLEAYGYVKNTLKKRHPENELHREQEQREYMTHEDALSQSAQKQHFIALKMQLEAMDNQELVTNAQELCNEKKTAAACRDVINLFDPTSREYCALAIAFFMNHPAQAAVVAPGQEFPPLAYEKVLKFIAKTLETSKNSVKADTKVDFFISQNFSPYYYEGFFQDFHMMLEKMVYLMEYFIDKQVHVINLSNCQLRTIPSGILSLANLKELNLSSNQIGKGIPHELFQLDNLEVVDLSDNKFVGYLPEGIINLKNLRIFDCSKNKLSGIPQSLGSQTISGSWPFGAPTKKHNLQKLEVFDVHDNGIICEIPEGLADLPALKKLDLSGNGFTGTIPATLRQKAEDITSELIINIDEQNL